jgi:hypothetical protein
MSDVPDSIVLKRDRDLQGRSWEIWARRALFALLPLVTALALVNLFGQRPASSTATGGDGSLNVYAPERVRGGLLFQARFTVAARKELKKAVLVLDPGWLESMTVNTIEPAPVNEASDNGRLTLELGHLPAGKSFVLFIQFQVNPTNVGHRAQDVALFDGPERVAQVHRSITIFP